MRTTYAVTLVAAASACLLIAMPVQADNLLLNPGFEDSPLGDLPMNSPTLPPGTWFSVPPGQTVGFARVVDTNVYLGARALVVQHDGVSLGRSFFQTVESVIPGQQYTLDFSAMASGAPPQVASTGILRVQFGSGPAQTVTLLDPLGSDPPGYAQYSLTLTVPTGGTFSTNLGVNWYSASVLSLLYFDDVSLTLVPEPSTVALLLFPLGAAVVRTLRRPRPA